MAKRKKKSAQRQPFTDAESVGAKLRIAIRSIIRDWQELRKPLPVDEITTPLPIGAQRYRIRGGESYEELQERVIEFAGRVWQIKDGLIKWLQTRRSLEITIAPSNLDTTIVGSSGQDAERTVEEAAKLCLPLLLCADLYNTHKHYDDCNRSGYQPFLNGVRFDTRKTGVLGILYDGARKRGDLTVANSGPVPIRIEMCSGSHSVAFGDAVVLIGRAFKYWIPLIRQMELLSPDDVVDKALLDDLTSVEAEIHSANAFGPNDAVVDVDSLPIEKRRLAHFDPARFIAEMTKPLVGNNAP